MCGSVGFEAVLSAFEPARNPVSKSSGWEASL